MRKYISMLLLLMAFFLFSTNAYATILSNDEHEVNRSKLVINGNRDNNVNINETDDNNIDNNNLNNNRDNTNIDDNRNNDGILDNDNNNLNNNMDLDTVTDDNEISNQTNFITVLSSGILGGLVGSIIIYLLMVRNK